MRGCKLPLWTLRVWSYLEDVLHGVLGGLKRVLLPRLAVVRAEDDDLALLVAQRREVGHLNDDRPGEKKSLVTNP